MHYNYINSFFACVLKIHCTNVSEFRLYQSTFGEYVESIHKYRISGLVGPVVLEPNTHLVYQLWSESQGIIHVANEAMLPIFKTFWHRSGP